MDNTEKTTIRFEIAITIEHPKGSTVEVSGGAPTVTESTSASPTSVETYFLHFLSANGRKVFRAAAELDDASEEPYSLEDIAERLGEPYPSVVSMYRSTGRTAKRWRNETGLTEPPFTLEDRGYPETDDRSGNRTIYRLTDGAAEQILGLDV